MENTLSLFYFPAALLLGALHALEPGHAKALTASYLIGIKGTKKDSVILGLSVAATHSLVVILIASIGLWLGNEAFTGEATKWLERGSGIIAITIGSWMLYRRLFIKRKSSVEGEQGHDHHEAEVIDIMGATFSGTISIVPTPIGERMRFASRSTLPMKEVLVEILRPNGVESLTLTRSDEDPQIYLSATAPSEPHEFKAVISINSDAVSFEMFEPEHHHHHAHHGEDSHAHLDDEAHARAHAATLPSYVNTGERPTTSQIIAFGAAGGMIPCPASITVMLLALSTGQAAMGFFTVMGFSLGLAIALVGVGIAIVSGLSKLSETGRLTWITSKAPAVSAGLVIASGVFALMIAH